MKKNNIFRVYVNLFVKLFRKAPWDFGLLLFFNLIDGIVYGIIIIFQKQFYDAASMFAQGNETLKVVIYALAILGMLKLLSPVLGSICRMSLAFFTEKMNGINQKEIYQKLARLEPIAFEDTKVLDNINKASQGMQATVGFVITISRIFVNHIPYFIIVGSFLFAQRPILVLSLLIIFIPVCVSLFSKLRYTQNLKINRLPKEERQTIMNLVVYHAPITRKHACWERLAIFMLCIRIVWHRYKSFDGSQMFDIRLSNLAYGCSPFSVILLSSIWCL